MKPIFLVSFSDKYFKQIPFLFKTKPFSKNSQFQLKIQEYKMKTITCLNDVTMSFLWGGCSKVHPV